MEVKAERNSHTHTHTYTYRRYIQIFFGIFFALLYFLLGSISINAFTIYFCCCHTKWLALAHFLLLVLILLLFFVDYFSCCSAPLAFTRTYTHTFLLLLEACVATAAACFCRLHFTRIFSTYSTLVGITKTWPIFPERKHSTWAAALLTRLKQTRRGPLSGKRESCKSDRCWW